MKDIPTNLTKKVINFILCTLTFSTLGCGTNKNSATSIESCLKSYDKNHKESVLTVCKNIIEKFPNNPQPLSDRSLIYTINSKNILACKDIRKAMNLINNSNETIDPLIKYQIEIRHNNCTKN